MTLERRAEFPGGSECVELERKRGELAESLQALLSPEALRCYLALDGITAEMGVHELGCFYRAGFADGMELHRALDTVSEATAQPDITAHAD